MRNIVRKFLPGMPIEIHAPLNVESVVRLDSANHRYIVHMITFLGTRDGQSQTSTEILVPLMEEMWQYRARIRLNQRIRNASAHSPDTQVKVQADSVEVEIQQIHESLVIQL